MTYQEFMEEKKLAQQDNNKKQNRVSFMAHEAKVAFTQAF